MWLVIQNFSSLSILIYPMRERRREKVDSANFLWFRNDEAVRLNADWDWEVDQAFVALIDGASDSPKENTIVS